MNFFLNSISVFKYLIKIVFKSIFYDTAAVYGHANAYPSLFVRLACVIGSGRPAHILTIKLYRVASTRLKYGLKVPLRRKNLSSTYDK